MSDDLVERVRKQHKNHVSGYCRGCRSLWPCDARRAADEIERLRTEESNLEIELSAKLESIDILLIHGEEPTDFMQSHSVVRRVLDLWRSERALRERLEKAADLKALIDEGFLVRSIEGDAEQGWALKILPKLQRLAEALRALDGEGE